VGVLGVGELGGDAAEGAEGAGDHEGVVLR
jgi:hypothetical protein